MQPPRSRAALDWRAAAWAGVAAGIVSTLAQLVAWGFVGALPEALFADSRRAAAIVMGARVLPPPASFDLLVMATATLVHFGLSIVYGVVLAQALRLLPRVRASWVGALFGLALYLVNLYGFTVLFPWFVAARRWDTLLAHLVFGVVAAGTYRRLSSRQGSPQALEP